jgi:1-acyl-sn-glycerol-3-phosphate acyltransferase
MDFWYKLALLISNTYRTFLIPRLHVTGRENIIPGPKIIVANHGYASDVFIIPAILKDRVHFLVQEDLLDTPFFGRLLALADQIPVVAGRGQEALTAAYDRLKKGHTVVIFPEGRLNHGKDMRHAQSGAIRLAVESGAPILPLGIFTPPEFTHMLSGRNKLGRSTLGGWQFGGSSFVAIGNSWNLAEEIQSIKDMEGYRKLRQASDDLKQRLEELVVNAVELAEKSGFQPALTSGSQDQ